MAYFIFDVDGTLVDTVDLHARAWQKAFSKVGGKDVRFERIRSQIGKGGDQLLPEFFDERELQEKRTALEEAKGSIFDDLYMDDVRPFPKVRELFEQILGRGHVICVASSAKKDELTAFLKKAGVEGLAEIETNADDVARSKPAPDVFRAVPSRLPEGAASKAVVIGDTPYDVRSAAKAGLRTIGVRCGGFDLENIGCIAIYDDPENLLEKLDEIESLVEGSGTPRAA